MIREWHASFLESLDELGNIERQRRAWVDGVEGSFPSPVELICQAFDDSGIDDLLGAGLVFSERTDELLRKISSLVGELDLNVSPDLLIQGEAWMELSRQAGRAFEMVRMDLQESGA